MGLSLSQQVSRLERKAERFDDAIDRIMDLKPLIDDYESGGASENTLELV